MDDWHPEALATIANRLGIAFTDLAPPRSRNFRTPGGPNIHVLDWGGEGPPAVLLHGGSLTARTWDYVAIAPPLPVSPYHPRASSTLPPDVAGLAAISAKAMMQGAVPLFTQLWM